jgi:hypothetical protein
MQCSNQTLFTTSATVAAFRGAMKQHQKQTRSKEKVELGRARQNQQGRQQWKAKDKL